MITGKLKNAIVKFKKPFKILILIIMPFLLFFYFLLVFIEPSLWVFNNVNLLFESTTNKEVGYFEAFIAFLGVVSATYFSYLLYKVSTQAVVIANEALQKSDQAVELSAVTANLQRNDLIVNSILQKREIQINYNSLREKAELVLKCINKVREQLTLGKQEVDKIDMNKISEYRKMLNEYREKQEKLEAEIILAEQNNNMSGEISELNSYDLKKELRVLKDIIINTYDMENKAKELILKGRITEFFTKLSEATDRAGELVNIELTQYEADIATLNNVVKSLSSDTNQ